MYLTTGKLVYVSVEVVVKSGSPSFSGDILRYICDGLTNYARVLNIYRQKKADYAKLIAVLIGATYCSQSFQSDRADTSVDVHSIIL